MEKKTYQRNILNGYEANSFIVFRQSILSTGFFVRLHQQQITMPQKIYRDIFSQLRTFCWHIIGMKVVKC